VTRKVFRDPALQKQFDRNGFVAVPMLTEEEVARLHLEIAALRPADAWAPDGRGPAMNSYHCSFLDTDRAFKRAAYDLLAAAFSRTIERYLDAYRPLSANFYSKPSGRGRIPVHQNWPVLDDLNATSVTVWCALVDVSEDNGTLYMVPGSHKLLPHVEGPRSPAYFSAFDDQLWDCLRPLTASAGAGFIFDDSIVHGSPDNAAHEARLAVQITCVPDESRPVFYFGPQDDGFELIDADSDFYLDQHVTQLAVRQPDWIGRGRARNRNRLIDKAEFLALLESRGTPRAGIRSFFGRLLGG